MNLEVKKITQIDDDTLNDITTWMYNWWGKKRGYCFEEITCYIKNSLQDNRLPQTYGLFLHNQIIGMYQITYEDLTIRPDIYPWLANVYIDEKYRGQGYGRYLLESVKEIVSKNKGFTELYLYTAHKNLYEKFGWTLIEKIDTYSKNPRLQSLYKLKLK